PRATDKNGKLSIFSSEAQIRGTASSVFPRALGTFEAMLESQNQERHASDCLCDRVCEDLDNTGGAVNEDQEICDLRRPHRYDLRSRFLFEPGSLENGRRCGIRIKCENLERGLLPGAPIPAKAAGRNSRTFMDGALGADGPPRIRLS